MCCEIRFHFKNKALKLKKINWCLANKNPWLRYWSVRRQISIRQKPMGFECICSFKVSPQKMFTFFLEILFISVICLSFCHRVTEQQVTEKRVKNVNFLRGDRGDTLKLWTLISLTLVRGIWDITDRHP